MLSGFVDLVFARVYGHDLLEEMSSVANVPIINGLSDSYHPLQVLADLLTLQVHTLHYIQNMPTVIKYFPATFQTAYFEFVLVCMYV